MKGITVLNTITHPIMGWAWTNAAIAIFIILLICAALIIYKAIKDKDAVNLIALLFLLLPAMFLVPAGTVQVDEYKTYQVILDDDVSFNEFLDRYEILDQDGRIFTIQERGVADG